MLIFSFVIVEELFHYWKIHLNKNVYNRKKNRKVT